MTSPSDTTNPSPIAPPPITVTLALSPTTYTYSNPPPTLTITATSHALRPITLYTLGSILSPHLALLQRQFTITDSNGQAAAQQHAMTQSVPPTRTRGSASDPHFLTLHPEELVGVSAVFGPSNYAAMAMDDERRVQTPGRQAKRSLQVFGVDGLVAGQEYVLGVDGEARGCWWRWGTREEVLVEPGTVPAGLGKGSGEDIKFDAGEIGEVRFWVE